MTDTPAPEDEVILEPGDPGYEEQTQPVEQPAEPPEPGPPGEDLTFQRGPNESDAEFMARTRHTVPVSESPTDVVPNRPNISMGEPVAVEGSEGLRYAVPPEGAGLPPGGAPQAETQTAQSEQDAARTEQAEETAP